MTIRAPNKFYEFVKNHTLELYGQDRWRIGKSTISLGLRYDLEVIPLPEDGNPFFSGANRRYAVDKNNVSPRVGITRALDDESRSVLRGGYGLFYNRTILGAIDDVVEFGRFTNSAVVQFPNNAADPGPSQGRFPTDPYLINGPTVNRALLNSQFPLNTLSANRGVVIYDTPNRQTPYAHQFTAGYTRQIGQVMAVAADFVKSMSRDMFLAYNAYPMTRANSTRTGPITRADAFGQLQGVTYNQQVWVMTNDGVNNYDALNLSLEKRTSNNWSGRISYSLGYSRGTAENQADKNLAQVGTNVNLDQWYAPSAVDRRHILAISGQTEIRRLGGVALSGTARYMSGAPFSIVDTNVDGDRNGELFDFAPAGTYSSTVTSLKAWNNVEYDGKRNGARGPDYFQFDVRAGWRFRMAGNRALNVFLDIYNITNRANFENPTNYNQQGQASADMRLTNNFLVLNNLRGGGGFPRQAQFGVRYQF